MRYLDFLKQKIETAPVSGFEIDDNAINPILKPQATLHKYGLEAQLDVAIEELSELMKAILKYPGAKWRNEYA